jgi:hypothetical protein
LRHRAYFHQCLSFVDLEPIQCLFSGVVVYPWLVEV